ncbi:Cytochrome p450 [Lasiodiplodia theobromae]|uniref:Cytochrome p450 n=1 Tax=Lasiodiplodia theobromae TaxID=45133 RepID=UPI0015C2F378|nr:Cytochrome p450 [Lasiodiplodia theobromae]KAF4546375.1 Cytochrome p450 [Lasiodiplodia theobromae]
MQVSESSTQGTSNPSQGTSNPPRYDQTGVDVPSSFDHEDDISDDEEDSNIDPQLLATAEDTFSTFLNSDDQAETAEDDDTATTMAMTEALTPLSTSPFPTETLAWIEALAKLNVVRRSRGLPSDQVVSPAKDSPSLFIYRCRNTSFGCSYTTSRKSHHLQHESGCTPERLERLSNITGRQELVCPRDGCGRTFMWKDSLNEHLRGHDYVPSRCPNPDCEDTTVFTNFTAFNEHRRMHDGAQKIDAPRVCPLNEKCNNRQTWKKANELKRHLRGKVHNLNDEEITALFRKYGTVRKGFMPRVCPLHDQCGNDQTWQRKSDLKGHLKHTGVHSLNKEAIDLLLGDTNVTDEDDLTHKMQKAGEQVKEAAKKIYQAALMLEASNAGIKPAKRQRTMEWGIYFDSSGHLLWQRRRQ